MTREITSTNAIWQAFSGKLYIQDDLYFKKAVLFSGQSVIICLLWCSTQNRIWLQTITCAPQQWPCPSMRGHTFGFIFVYLCFVFALFSFALEPTVDLISRRAKYFLANLLAAHLCSASQYPYCWAKCQRIQLIKWYADDCGCLLQISGHERTVFYSSEFLATAQYHLLAEKVDGLQLSLEHDGNKKKDKLWLCRHRRQFVHHKVWSETHFVSQSILRLET